MAYFLVATRDMPKSRAMARRDSPCFLAFFTVSQRACWAGGGMRVHLVAHRLDLSAPPLAGYVLDPGPLIHRGVQGDQELPLVLTQVAAGPPNCLRHFSAGEGVGALSPKGSNIFASRS